MVYRTMRASMFLRCYSTARLSDVGNVLYSAPIQQLRLLDGSGPVHAKLWPREEANSLIDSKQLSVAGLSYLPNFVSIEQQQRILQLVDANPFAASIRRRMQFWGQVYYHTTHDVQALQPVVDPVVLPSMANHESGTVLHPSLPLSSFNWLLSHTRTLLEPYHTHPVPISQILVNEYIGDAGLSCHLEDTNAFGDYIYTLSLLNPVWMDLKPIYSSDDDTRRPFRILLEPRSMLVMSGDARFKWRHGITKGKKVQMPDGAEFIQRGDKYRRLSLTMRRKMIGSGKERDQEDFEQSETVRLVDLYGLENHTSISSIAQLRKTAQLHLSIAADLNSRANAAETVLIRALASQKQSHKAEKQHPAVPVSPLISLVASATSNASSVSNQSSAQRSTPSSSTQPEPRKPLKPTLTYNDFLQQQHLRSAAARSNSSSHHRDVSSPPTDSHGHSSNITANPAMASPQNPDSHFFHKSPRRAREAKPALSRVRSLSVMNADRRRESMALFSDASAIVEPMPFMTDLALELRGLKGDHSQKMEKTLAGNVGTEELWMSRSLSSKSRVAVPHSTLQPPMPSSSVNLLEFDRVESNESHSLARLQQTSQQKPYMGDTSQSLPSLRRSKSVNPAVTRRNAPLGSDVIPLPSLPSQGPFETRTQAQISKSTTPSANSGSAGTNGGVHKRPSLMSMWFNKGEPLGNRPQRTLFSK
ncbi:hypothetical protein HDU78_009500 [Chytriomyces hyalinus]|nr:hypothetical protein HDU78_009500 [Chytriomyces hyalinus]